MRERLLDSYCTIYRFQGTREFGQEAVAKGLEQTPPVCLDLRTDYFFP
jgi:hypothetical protein